MDKETVTAPEKGVPPIAEEAPRRDPQQVVDELAAFGGCRAQ